MRTKEVVSTAALGACVGIAIGVTIELICSYIAGQGYSPGTPGFLDGFENINNAVLIERVIYALYGAICAFASLLYGNEKRPLMLTSAMHGSIVLICGLAAGTYLKWWKSGIELLGIVVMIVVIYLAIWLVMYFLARAEVRNINEKL
ncbi:MAG: DUF3021 domain-containing protein [Actinomycetaceae bacterium]|nr:DUF3021 domain-containing protein [Arcanobacterium sp.]MDD7687080.1 DUF3021 domain-containing protein [Actinomycetaceae bacterium]